MDENGKLDEQTRCDIAQAFQQAVVDTIIIKCKRALQQTGYKRLVMAGGVSANKQLRADLAEMMKSPWWRGLLPTPTILYR